MKEHIEALAKKAAESSVGADAAQFAQAAHCIAEAHGIVEHVDDVRSDRRAAAKRAEKAEAEEAAQKSVKGAPKTIAA